MQTAVEIAIDLRSALADWTLTKLVDDDTRVAASEDLLAFAEGFGCGEAVKAARQEIESIANSSMRKMGDLYRQGQLNTVWGHDYASGLDHSLRRGARWCTSNPCKIQGYKKDFPGGADQVRESRRLHRRHGIPDVHQGLRHQRPGPGSHL